MIRMPEYVDGCFELFRITHDEEKDFPEEKIEPTGLEMCYRELSVFDRTKYEFEQGGREITMKIRIPRCKEINSECICLIDGEKHLVYNAAHVVDKNGFRETELTLIRPGKELNCCE